jgi:hypothetical protein
MIIDISVLISVPLKLILLVHFFLIVSSNEELIRYFLLILVY